VSPSEIPRNVLVVEDEWLIALDITMLIEDEGHVVIGPAKSVARAVDLIEDNAIDIAFLDITLGEEKSYPIAEKLAALGVPLTFVSAYNKSDIPSEFQDFDCLSKPVPSDLFRDQLLKLIDQTRT